MSLVDQLASRFKAQFISELVSALAGAILIFGLARLLDPDEYGLLFLALTVFGTLQLIAQLGIARSAGRYVAEYKEKDPTQVPFIVRTSLLLNTGTILVVVVALAISYRQIAIVFGEQELAQLLLFGIFLVALGTGIEYLRKVLQGFEAIKFAAFLRIFTRISRLILALGLVAVGFGVIGALWGYLLSALLTCVIGFVYLYHRLRRFRENATSIESGLRRRIIEYAIPITATNTAHILDRRVDTLLVGFFLSPVAVSYYVISERVVNFIEKPMNALGFTLTPAFGTQKAAGNLDQISRIYEVTLVNVLLLYVPAAAGIVLVADPMIHLVFGPDYDGAVVVLQVLGLYVILRAVTKITGNGLDYLGRARDRAIVRGATSSLNVVLNVFLIPAVGVVGAAIATVVTYGIYTVANVYIVSQEFKLRIGYLSRQIGWIVLITGLMSAVIFVLSEYISGWISLLMVVSVGVLVWAVLSVATGLLEVRRIVSLLT